MTSAIDIGTDALIKLGVYAPGETISGADQAQVLVSLNNMLDGWADDNLYVSALSTFDVTLVIGTAAYTLPARPSRLYNGPGRGAVTIGASTTPVNIVSQVEWNVIQSGYQASGTPDTIFYDPQYPAGVVNVRPIPSAAGTLTFQGWAPLVKFADLTSPYTLSEGTEEALKTNLSIALKPYFAVAQIDPIIVAAAADSKTTLRQYAQTSRAMIRRQRDRSPNASGP